MTKTSQMSQRRRNLSESDARNSGDETHPPLTTSPSLEGTNFSNYLFSNNSAATSVEYIVSLADDRVIKVEVDARATGNDVLTKVCFNLGIFQEMEYFSLLYRGRSNEWLWVNLRNRLSRQLVQTNPNRLDFRVKYFVQPHVILSDECRHQFFLHAKNQVIEGCWLHGVPEQDLNHILALVAQSEFGDMSRNISTNLSMMYAKFWPRHAAEDIHPGNFREIEQYHKSLEGWTSSKAAYEALRLMADNWVMFGVTMYIVRDCHKHQYAIGVGPEGLYKCHGPSSSSDAYQLISKHSFESIDEVNYTDNILELRFLQDDSSVKSDKYSMESSKMAKSFQRYVTEMNQFFMYDTVEKNVIDLAKSSQGPFWFKRRASSVKSYQYDVTKTSREVYDSARRKIHASMTQRQESASGSMSHSVSGDPAAVLNTIGNASNNSCDINKAESNQTASEEEVEEMRREIENLRDLVQCIVCRDQKINRVFIPCMHIVCCDACASRVTQCPMCRVHIKMSHHAFPRWIDDTVGGNHQRLPQLCPVMENEVLTNSQTQKIERLLLGRDDTDSSADQSKQSPVSQVTSTTVNSENTTTPETSCFKINIQQNNDSFEDNDVFDDDACSLDNNDDEEEVEENCDVTKLGPYY